MRSGSNMSPRVLLTFALILSLAPQVQAAELRPPSLKASWLDTVNYYRKASDLPPIAEDPQRTAMSKAHVYYLANTPSEFLVGDYVNLHKENPASPFYSELGAKSGSNIAWASNPSEAAFIDQWMAAPFHAMGILRENLETSGFAVATGAAISYYVAALDVFGINYSKQSTKTIVFPGNNSTVRLSTFYGESPDPREGCGPDWKNFRGLPLFVSFPNPLTRASTGSLTLSDGKTLNPGEELCVVDSFNYATSDAVYGPAGRAKLSNVNMVILIPKLPLNPGLHTASVSQPGGQQVTWKFNVLPKLDTLKFRDNPERDQIEWDLIPDTQISKIQGYQISRMNNRLETIYTLDKGSNFFDTSSLPEGWNYLCIQPFDESSIAKCTSHTGVFIDRGWSVKDTEINKADLKLNFTVQPNRSSLNRVPPNVIVIIKDMDGNEVMNREVQATDGYLDITELATGKHFDYRLFIKGQNWWVGESGWFKIKKPTTTSDSANKKESISKNKKLSDGYPEGLKVPGRTCSKKGATALLFQVKLKCASLSGALTWVRSDGKTSPVLPLGTECKKAGEKLIVINREYLCKSIEGVKIWLPAT